VEIVDQSAWHDHVNSLHSSYTWNAQNFTPSSLQSLPATWIASQGIMPQSHSSCSSHLVENV
jgi:hypothetical protein